MPRLILVRHAAPRIDPATPSADWPLSAEGREGAARLGEALAAYTPAALVSGPEPKMVETGRIIAAAFGLESEPVAELAEHARRSTRFGDRADFETTISELFARPAELIYGDESADAAHARFAGAVDRTLADWPNGDIIVVSGGTVISLFVSRRAGIDPYPFWRALGLPTAVVLDRGRWRIGATLG